MTNSADRVEVLSRIQRRRRHTLEQERAVLADAAHPGMSISYIARCYLPSATCPV